MKVIAQTLTVYLFAIAFIPCGDGGEGLSVILGNQQEALSVTAAADHHQHSNDCGDDDCSPFCVCNCCSIVLHPTAKASLATAAVPGISSDDPFNTKDIVLSAFLQSIWQPPKG